MRDDFEEKWRMKEIEIANTARQRKREWLKDREVSKELFGKKFNELKKQFFEPPTPDNAEREKNLESLANVVLINIESHLFRKGRLLKDFIHEFDTDGNGYVRRKKKPQVTRARPLLRVRPEKEKDPLFRLFCCFSSLSY